MTRRATTPEPPSAAERELDALEMWLLLLLGFPDADNALDLLRLDAGLELLHHQPGFDGVGVPRAASYADVEHALSRLISKGAIRSAEPGTLVWSEFTITPSGLSTADAFLHNLKGTQRQAARQLAKVKRDVLTKSFRELVDYLRLVAPEFAARVQLR